MPKSFFRRFTKKILVLCNIFFDLLFLLSCYGYLFNPQNFWPIGLLTLGSFYLLLMLLLFILFWIFIKPTLASISIIAIIISLGPIKQLIPLRFATSFNIKKQSSNIRLMSWNVAQFNVLHYKTQPEIKENMLKLINENNPDIFCCQEMVCADTYTDTTTSYYRKYSYYSLDDFKNKLQFPYQFYSYNVKEDFLNNQHFGVLIFSKYPIINKQTITNYPNNYNSIFQYVDIVKGMDTIRVFNIHLQSLKFSNTNLKYIEKPKLEEDKAITQSISIFGKLKIGFLKRKVQSDKVQEEIKKSPYPVIVCGDFNDVPNSYAYHTIGKSLKNSFAEKGSGIGRTFSGVSPTLHIDNIFVDNIFDVIQFTRIKKVLSDHFPIISDVHLNKN